GHLTGSIDLVLRVRDGDVQRFVVVDYKTNALHDPSRSVGDSYGREQLVHAMSDAHYPLQALLYSVALHRYLRWRLPGYDPDRNLGGIAYLFVRGMTGGSEEPATSVVEHPPGIARWDLSPKAVIAVSDLLAGGPGGTVR
ncbi:MAG: PD-(D/E)XK nuclease family protein, partial [Actinobacteria bacterium]|nr:PD-(D/E)XK nuclease family protein [Actinomycetota bacterium]